MTQFNTLNVTLSNSQLNKLKSGIKHCANITLNLSSNMFDNSNDDTNFPNKSLLSNTEVLGICKAFANNSSANKTCSKIQINKIGQ